MKKITFLLAATLGLVSFAAQAQQATVNVRLHPIQTIVVNAATSNVNLDYKTEADYEDGVNANQADHLSVYSTGAFAVSVKSDNATLESINPQVNETIAASDIYVTAKAGTTSALAGVVYKDAVSLTTDAQELFSSSTGGVNKTFDVNYAAKGDANAYVNKYFNVENPTVYTTKVTYSIQPK